MAIGYNFKVTGFMGHYPARDPNSINIHSLVKALKKVNGVVEVKPSLEERLSHGSPFHNERFSPDTSIRYGNNLELQISHYPSVAVKTLEEIILRFLPNDLMGNKQTCVPHFHYDAKPRHFLNEVTLKIPTIKPEDSPETLDNLFDALTEVPGVTNVQFSILRKNATVYYRGELKLDALIQATEKAGHKVELEEPEMKRKRDSEEKEETKEKEQSKEKETDEPIAKRTRFGHR
ncbi:MAG: heavy-metal-associated domain-containing protein [Candidatus Berkiellales bacterium]